jgi:RhtB (resistance to homoserine/threonine) family protein
MNYLPQLLTVALIHLLAVISPGPDFVMTIRNAFKYSTRTAIWSSVGLGLGIATHVFYTIVGIGLLVSKSIIAFSVIKYLGAAYLIYIGYKSLTSKTKASEDELQISKVEDISPLNALKIGYLTNVLNPKATIFIVSLFSQVINPSTPLSIKLIYGIEMCTVTTLWFSFVGIIAAHPMVKSPLSRAQHHIERITGGILILFGLKLAFTKK